MFDKIISDRCEDMINVLILAKLPIINKTILIERLKEPDKQFMFITFKPDESEEVLRELAKANIVVIDRKDFIHKNSKWLF